MAEKEKISAILIFEILGRPKEHLAETLEKLLNVIEKEKGIVITSKKVHEPKLVESKDKESKKADEPETWTSFSEAELEAEDIMDLLRVMFTYMPAHVEIISPEDFQFSNIDFNSISNEILRRLHHYDAIAKSAIINNQMMAIRMKEYIEKIKAEKESGKKDNEESAEKDAEKENNSV